MNHTYDVEFYRKDGSVGASARVQAEGMVVAIKTAGTLRTDQIAAGADWGTKVTLVDTEAEAKERETNANLYEDADAARALFVSHGFVDQGNGWFKHERKNLHAGIDHHSGPEYGRFAGIFQHQIAPNGRDVMIPFALIPWYGDGATMGINEELLEALLQTVTN